MFMNSTQSNETLERRRVFNRARLLDEVALQIHAAMEREGLSRAQLADKLGVSRPMITKILNGSNNFRLETLADIFLAFGLAAHIELDQDVARVHTPEVLQQHENPTECYSIDEYRSIGENTSDDADLICSILADAQVA
jgi:transcriptional regulator with XRE-family HTH domain